mmetsp:Transcript_7587/g.19984  ORF Transcript_7587/g.19984 Transcript_7587/m.19984 type:complete len:230 (+) Transcript_7587:228-917(+)
MWWRKVLDPYPLSPPMGQPQTILHSSTSSEWILVFLQPVSSRHRSASGYAYVLYLPFSAQHRRLSLWRCHSAASRRLASSCCSGFVYAGAPSSATPSPLKRPRGPAASSGTVRYLNPVSSSRGYRRMTGSWFSPSGVSGSRRAWGHVCSKESSIHGSEYAVPRSGWLATAPRSQPTGTFRLTFARMSATHWSPSASAQPVHDWKYGTAPPPLSMQVAPAPSKRRRATSR